MDAESAVKLLETLESIADAASTIAEYRAQVAARALRGDLDLVVDFTAETATKIDRFVEDSQNA